MSEIRRIQAEQKEWSDRNFPTKAPYQPLIGMMEELGELSHAHLKQEQGIRGTYEEHQAAAKDAIGDIVIFMMDYCNQRGFDLESIVAETWAEVKRRDWTKNGGSGE